MAIWSLLKLTSTPLLSASVIEQAFYANCVDEAFIGDWDEVQVRLGLKSRDQVPKKYHLNQFPEVANASIEGWRGFSSGATKAKGKKERKMQQAVPEPKQTEEKIGSSLPIKFLDCDCIGY